MAIEVLEDYWPTGQKMYEIWTEDHRRHRADETGHAALTRWTPTGVKTTEFWFNRGLFHRMDGPAYNIWTPSGRRKTEESWWIWGVCYALTQGSSVFLDRRATEWVKDNNLPIAATEWPDELKLLFKLMFA